jgi:hypothetical protein
MTLAGLLIQTDDARNATVDPIANCGGSHYIRDHCLLSEAVLSLDSMLTNFHDAAIDSLTERIRRGSDP